MILKRGDIMITLFCLYVLDNKDITPTTALFLLTSVLLDLILIPLELLLLIAVFIYFFLKTEE